MYSCGKILKGRKMKRKLLFISSLIPLLLTGCSTGEEKIYINGDIEKTIEVNTEYADEGVTFPEEKYTLIKKGEVNPNKIGKYEVVYSLYTSDGELAKELHRFVSVVDTTVPTYEMKTGQTYYVGFSYSVSDFLTYSDNYTESDKLIVTPKSYTFTRQGEQEITIDIEDSSKNKANATFKITPTFDFYKLASTKYSYVKQSTASSVGTYTTITMPSLLSSQTLTYYESGSLHYLESVKTELGKSASIQVSAKFGDFSNADVSYHINGTGSSYSVGFAYIDATQKTATINSFRSTINNLSLDTSKMLEELNANIDKILENFHDCMENTLHLDIY